MVTWNSANAYNAGSEGLNGTDASQQVFRMYLDDGDGGDSYFATDGYGASVQVSGLASSWESSGAGSYSLTLYFSTDATGSPRRKSVRDCRSATLPPPPSPPCPAQSPPSYRWVAPTRLPAAPARIREATGAWARWMD